MPLNDHRPLPGWAGTRLCRCILGGMLSFISGSGALGQVNGARAVVGELEMADLDLKTCLQRHYEADNEDMSVYRSGNALVAACRNEWDAARSACAAQPGETHEYCDARTKLMLLGFVPMR